MEQKNGKRDNGKREELIKIGIALFTEKGFYNTPLEQLVTAAKVPKGSFYYYFSNKDEYTKAVISGYAEYFARKLNRVLTDTTMQPFDRIKSFTDEAARGMEKYEFKRGCLVGNLGQELGALDENFRVALLAVLHDWRARIQACLEEAKTAGQLDMKADTATLAKYFWNAWEGAVLCAKLEKNRSALDEAAEFFLAYLKTLRPTAA